MVDVRRKGKKGEYEVVDKLRKEGIEAKRVPLSGSTEFCKGDVILKIGEVEYKVEVKRRKRGYKHLYESLKGKDMLMLRDDREDWLVVLRYESFLDLVRR